MSKAERAMLTALAQYRAGLTRKKIRIYTGYADSGPTSKAMGALVANGWAGLYGDKPVVTDQGLAALGPYESLPSGDDLRAMLLSGHRLSTAEKKLLGALCDAWPESVTRADLRDRTGYADSGPTSKAMGHLVGLDYVVDNGRAGLRAIDDLFSVTP